MTEAPVKVPTLFHETYNGDRWRYAFTNRPFGLSCQPDGFIVGSQQDHFDYRHGMIDYPLPLSDKAIADFELVFVGAVLTEDGVNAQVLYPSERCWLNGETVLFQYADLGALWQLDPLPLHPGELRYPDPLALNIPTKPDGTAAVFMYELRLVKQFDGMMHLEGFRKALRLPC